MEAGSQHSEAGGHFRPSYIRNRTSTSSYACAVQAPRIRTPSRRVWELQSDFTPGPKPLSIVAAEPEKVARGKARDVVGRMAHMSFIGLIGPPRPTALNHIMQNPKSSSMDQGVGPVAERNHESLRGTHTTFPASALWHTDQDRTSSCIVAIEREGRKEGEMTRV